MAIEKKLICFARLAEFERQLAAGNILDYSIVFIQDAKMIWNRGTYYDCNGSSDAAVYGDGYINSEVRDDGTHLKTNVADNLGAVSARGQLADALDVKTFVENAVQGGGGITVETDPVFSASPAASITEAKKTEWDNKVDKVSGKQLSTNDFTNEYRSKLDGIDEHVQSDWAQGDVANASYIKNRTHYASVISYVGEFVTVSKEVGDVLCEGLSIGGIYTIINQTNTVNRTMFQFVVGRKINIPFNGPTVEALCSENGSLVLASSTGGIVQSFSVHYTEAKPLDDVYIPETIARKAEIATINGQSLTDGGDITIEGGSLTESDIAAMGFTKNTGTYSKPSTGIPKSDLASAVQTSLGKADTALQSYTEQYKGTVTGVKINGTTKSPSSGVVDLGTVITDVSNLATKDEVILKDVTGELVTVQTQALYGGGSVYALPDTANGDEDDILLSSNSVKTINGQSIVGSGDIEIGGGSSSGGNGAYAEVNHGTSDTTFTLTPNTFHVWDEVSSLTLTLGSETAGVANEFLFQFTSGATATSLTLPDDIKWANDSAPTIEENMIYQVSILKGLASVLEFDNPIVFPVIDDTGGSANSEYKKVYDYFVSKYALIDAPATASSGVAITEMLIISDNFVPTYGIVKKVSLNNGMLVLWTQSAIDALNMPTACILSNGATDMIIPS